MSHTSPNTSPHVTPHPANALLARIDRARSIAELEVLTRELASYGSHSPGYDYLLEELAGRWAELSEER
jgi:hypothetical protein